MPVVQRTACTSEDQSLNLNYSATDIGRAEELGTCYVVWPATRGDQQQVTRERAIYREIYS